MNHLPVRVRNPDPRTGRRVRLAETRPGQRLNRGQCSAGSEKRAIRGSLGGVVVFALTWNIDGGLPARTELYRFLNTRRGEGVVAVQEWVPYSQAMPAFAVIDAEVSARTNNRFRLVTVALGKGRSVLLASESIKWVNEVESKRLVSATFASAAEGWRGLRIIGVHARSKLWGAAERHNRDLHMAKLIRDLSGHWAQTGGPALMLGDFNAEPFAEEIAGRGRLGACRERLEVVEHGFRGIGTPALYNPTWALLGDSDNALVPAGTYYYKDEGRGVQWQCIDQLMVSREIAVAWKTSWNPRMLPRLSRHHVLADGRPVTPLSDHVPLFAELAINQVKECQI